MKAYSSIHPPLKRALIFEFEYEKAENLEEIRERLEKWYCILHPRKDLLVMRSSAEEGPTKIIFVLLEKDKRGGEIILIETKDSWYNYEKILSSLRAYCKNAGIKLRKSSHF